MPLSKTVRDTLVDLIENKLAVMQIGDREDLREVIVLQHCIAELRGLSPADLGIAHSYNDIPRRGRRRKVSAMIDEMRDGMMQQVEA
jgi:hypothetical protein